jgi:hypothetical protein
MMEQGKLQIIKKIFDSLDLFLLYMSARELRSYHEDVKYIMDQALFPPGASGLPKHMHFVTHISSAWPERRNRKAPTP